MIKEKTYIALTVLNILILFFFFGKIILSPNSYLFAPGGDGIKNYYTPAYYVKYDSGAHFSGMNYPYGENFIYTDNQPLISYLLGLINRNLFEVHEHTIGIINMLMILSIFFSVYLLYLILKRLKLPDWYSIPIALLLAYFTPQIERLTGHYALAYAYFIPLIWLMTIRLFEKKNWLLLISTSSIITLHAFIHVYFLMIGSLFLLTYSIIYFLQTFKKTKNQKWFVLKAISFSILPVVIFKYWLYLFDPIIDRPNAPWGIFNYTASFESVFIPTLHPFNAVWNYFIDIKKPEWEGLAYVGFVGLISLIVIILKCVFYIKKKKIRLIFNPAVPGFLRTSIWVAFVILFFSMCYPFKLGLEFLLDIIPQIKQFRSLGRFAWIFYYIYTIFSAYLFYMIYRKIKMKGFRLASIIVILFVFISWSISTQVNVKNKTDYILNINKENIANNFLANEGNYENWITESGYKKDDFQAILALPHFLVGSEKFDINRSGSSSFEAMKASLNTGLPIIEGMLSRTSLSNTIKLNQLISSDNIKKEILDDLNDNRPLLLIKPKGASLLKNENEIYNKSKLFFENDFISLSSLSLSSLQNNFNQIKEIADSLRKDTLSNRKNSFYYPSGNYHYYNDYEETKHKIARLSDGCLYQSKGPMVAFNEYIEANVSTDFELSFWLHINATTSGFPICHLQEFDVDNEKEINHMAINPKEINEVYNEWVMIKFYFKLTRSGNRVKVYIDGKEIRIDDLLVKDKASNHYIFREKDSVLFYNTYMIK